MPHYPQLNAFFKRLHEELREEWDNRVDAGKLTDHAFHFRLSRLEEIGSILRALTEGRAALRYKSKTPREPSPLIRLRQARDDG